MFSEKFFSFRNDLFELAWKRSSLLVSKKFASYESGQWAHGWLALAERVSALFNSLSSNKSISNSWEINNERHERFILVRTTKFNFAILEAGYLRSQACLFTFLYANRERINK